MIYLPTFLINLFVWFILTLSPRLSQALAQARSVYFAPIWYNHESYFPLQLSVAEYCRQPQYELAIQILVLAWHSSVPGLNCLEFDIKIILRILTLHFRKDFLIQFQLNHTIILFFSSWFRISFKMHL